MVNHKRNVKAASKPAETVKPAAAETETKAAPVKTAEEPKAAATAEAKEPVKAAPAKAAEPKAAPAKKTAAKTAPAKKAKEPKVAVHVQFDGKDIVAKDVLDEALKAYKKGHRGAEIKDVQLYIVAGESAAYYVVNGEAADEFKIEL